MQPNRHDIKHTAEPPASVGGGAQNNQSPKLPYIVLAVAVILAVVAVVFSAGHINDAGSTLAGKLKQQVQSELSQDGSQDTKNNIDNQCLSFTLPTKLPVNEHGPLCYASADSFDQSITVELLPADVTVANLQKRAEADFARQNPNISSSNQAGNFAGLPSYLMMWQDSNARTVTRYYVYNGTETVTLRGVTYHAYSVTFSGRTDTFNLIKNVENSWKWKTVGDDPKNQYLEAPVSNADTACYNITAANIAKVYFQGDCTLRMVTDLQTMDDVSVKHLIGRQVTAKDYANQWRWYSKTTTVLSESAIKVDGKDAYRIEYQYKANPNDGQQVIIFVPTGDSYTTAGGAPGFEISGNYSTVDTLLASWHWN